MLFSYTMQGIKSQQFTNKLLTRNILRIEGSNNGKITSIIMKNKRVINIKVMFFEKIYNYFLNSIFKIINPIKEGIIKTKCLVHIYLNNEALTILKNEKYYDEYKFFHKYLDDINDGAVWADQDFKSSNHFYNPYKRRGLLGRKNALDLGLEYYNKSIKLWKDHNYYDSMFYLGAALHIIQDMTIPQHANIRLLDNHRQYETFVKRIYQYIGNITVEKGAYLLDSYENFIRFNARVALKIHKRFKVITDDELRFLRITRCTLPLAKRTSAGALILFYNNVHY